MGNYLHSFSDSLIDKAVVEGKLTGDDGDIIELYLNGSYAEDYRSATRYNVFYILVLFRQYIGEYRKNTTHDLFDGITKYKESNRTLTTKVNQLSVLMQFYGWLIDRGDSSIPKDMISHKIKIRSLKRDPESNLTFDDADKLIKACKNSRNRAFIALLYESGIRTKEACELKWEDLVPDEQGIFLISNGKKVANQTPCILATGYLRAWKNDYPGNASGENFVFITQKGDPLTAQVAFRILGRIVKESGITKNVHLRSINKNLVSHDKRVLEGDELISKKLWEIG
jgi:integrase/recombinase XerD